jgi:uncharacterized membrane protein YfcA
MLGNIDPLVALLVFLLTAVMDALHAVYTKAVASNQAGRAATFGSVIYLISGFAVIQYTQNHVYLVFMVLGSWIGVYLSVKAHILSEQRKSAKKH